MSGPGETRPAFAGLWRENPAMVQMLGLCPLLAVSTSFATSLGLGVVTLIVLVGSNVTVSLLRNTLTDTTRLPIQIMIIASFVTAADIALAGWFFDLHQRIGLFVALIVTNCALLGRSEAYARRNPVLPAAGDGLMVGAGFLWLIVLVGTIREVLGQGTLFANLHLLVGGTDRTVRFADSGTLLFLLPPGAFLTLGCIIAVKNLIDQQSERHEQDQALRNPDTPAGGQSQAGDGT
jgi:electron transport complex protein RnfE